MNKQQVVMQKRKKIKFYLQTKEVAKRLLKIMVNHKGINNCIDKEDLIKEVWNLNAEETTELQYFFCVELIKKGMHFLRKKTQCQPIALLLDNEWQYFIPVNDSEAGMYEKNMQGNINGIKEGIKTLHKSVKEKWYNKIWYIEEKENKNEI